MKKIAIYIILFLLSLSTQAGAANPFNTPMNKDITGHFQGENVEVWFFRTGNQANAVMTWEDRSYKIEGEVSQGQFKGAMTEVSGKDSVPISATMENGNLHLTAQGLSALVTRQKELDFSGEWKNDDVLIRFEKSPNRRFKGQMAFKGIEYKINGLGIGNWLLGSFEVEGQPYQIEIGRENGKPVFISGNYRQPIEQTNKSAAASAVKKKAPQTGGDTDPLLKKALAGDKVAMNKMGIRYEKGQGVPKDPGKAVYWYRKAADAGSAGGMINLARHYNEGKGVEKSLEKRAFWYGKAAEKGHVRAVYVMGNIYMYGEGVAKNYPEAARWFEKAAQKGHVDAMYNLAWLHEKGKLKAFFGHTGNRNFEEAAKWYYRASQKGDEPANKKLVTLYRQGRFRYLPSREL